MTPGQLSADGRWRWDGARWVPTTEALAQPSPYVPMPYAPAAPTNTLAIVSLVAGIVSWVLCPFVGAIVAVITGHVARGQVRKTGEAGGSLAMAGLVLGYVHLAAFAVVILIWVLLLGGFAILAASSSH